MKEARKVVEFLINVKIVNGAGPSNCFAKKAYMTVLVTPSHIPQRNPTNCHMIPNVPVLQTIAVVKQVKTPAKPIISSPKC